MPALKTRKIIRIDEEKCDGCGDCVPSCAEGAIRIVGGKARLVAENLCDGMGACLGKCPKGAIIIEDRPAEDFDPGAVERHKRSTRPAPLPATGRAGHPAPAGSSHGHPGHIGGPSGCPGSAFREIGTFPGAAAKPRSPSPAPRSDAPAPRDAQPAPSRLSHWPVQLALLPPAGRIWQDAHVLIAADCVAFALPDFQERLLAGKSLAVACPKLDDVGPYMEKLTEVFSRNNVLSVTVAHMEVPCCTGILHAVQIALERSGRTDIPLADVVVSIQGRIL